MSETRKQWYKKNQAKCLENAKKYAEKHKEELKIKRKKRYLEKKLCEENNKNFSVPSEENNKNFSVPKSHFGA